MEAGSYRSPFCYLCVCEVPSGQSVSSTYMEMHDTRYLFKRGKVQKSAFPGWHACPMISVSRAPSFCSVIHLSLIGSHLYDDLTSLQYGGSNPTAVSYGDREKEGIEEEERENKTSPEVCY